MARFRDEREAKKQRIAQATEDATRRIGNGGFNHSEAFCLMKYADAVGNVEVIWNSRDGVTPFIVRSRAGREMKHVDWRDDRRVEHHVPAVGDRIFVDLTIERAREFGRRQVEEAWDREKDPMREHPFFESMTKEEAAESLAKSHMEYGGGGSPDIVEVDDKLRAELERRARDAVQAVIDRERS